MLTWPFPSGPIISAVEPPAGRRWLSHVNGDSQGIFEVGLTYSPERDRQPDVAWLVVETEYRPYEPWPGHRTLIGLLSATTPARSARAARKYSRGIGRFSEEHALRLADWPTATWRLDDDEVTAHIFTFAGAWAGFALVDDVRISCLGTAPVGHDLVLTSRTDVTDLGLEPGQPVEWPDCIEESERRAWGHYREPGPPEPWPMHPDHQRVLALVD